MAFSAVPSSTAPPADRFAWGIALFAILAVVACILLPVLLVSSYTRAAPEASSSGATEAVVGTAVLLRVAMRRVLRTAARNLLQTTLGTFSRTSARTVTRRVVRLAVKSATVTAKAQLTSVPDEDFVRSPAASLRAVFVGFVALFASFWGVLWVAHQAGDVTLTEQLSAPLAALLAALPMLLFALLVMAAARWQGVQARFQTGLDGLLLQAYFTGAGSFLPLTTDIEYRGEREALGRVAACVLGGLLGTHWILYLAAHSQGSPTGEFAAAMVLIYGFVYSFPLRPLDGYFLWQKSRWQWAVLWLAMLLSFVRNMPDGIQGIL